MGGWRRVEWGGWGRDGREQACGCLHDVACKRRGGIILMTTARGADGRRPGQHLHPAWLACGDRLCHSRCLPPQVVREGFDPRLGLFQATTDNRLYPNPHAQVGGGGRAGGWWVEAEPE